MTTRTKKITEEKYKELINMDTKAAAKAMVEMAPADWQYGYGIYGARAVERGGVFQIEYTTGDSMD